MFREVAERARRKEEMELPFQGGVRRPECTHSSETALMNYLKGMGVADFYWDYESPLVRDKRTVLPVGSVSISSTSLQNGNSSPTNRRVERAP